MKTFLLGIVACLATAALGQQAQANQFTVNCIHNAATDQAAFTTALGGAGYPSLKNGDVIVVNGTNLPGTGLCAGDYRFNPSITIVNNTASSSSALVATDGFDGMVEIAGSHVTIDGITLTGASLNPANTSNATISSNFNESGALAVHDGGVATVQNSQIGPSQVSGIFAVRSSAVSVVNSTISGNGQGSGGSTFGTNFSAGIFAVDASLVRLGSGNGTNGVTIGGNGLQSGSGCPGFGIILAQSSSLDDFVSTIGGPSSGSASGDANTCGQMIMESGSSARLEATTVTQPDHVSFGNWAIQATDGSTVFLDPNGNVSGAAANDTVTSGTTGANTSGAILLAGSTSLVMNNATVTAPGTGQATIEASTGSSFLTAGGNTINNATAGGVAVEIDHSSSFLQSKAQNFGFASGGTENITGKGSVLMQSSMELGQGPTGVPSFSMVWNGTIAVGQNSAIRMQSGSHVTGQVQISAASNGYFNCNNNNNSCSGTGAQNQIDGHVLCLQLTGSPNNPSAHVSNPQLIVDASGVSGSGVVVANLFGPSSFATSTPAANTCLNF
ncbi:MAG TPA: hypothetical protein VGP48_02800 [Stellaceae bacterium]|jgi:hypothetical protein|nr:hypothetical protein [Stellaceae bacterium]